MSISIGGLASGLDTNSLIDQLLAVERIPITNMQFRQTVAETKADVYKDVGSRLSTLKDLAFDLTLNATFAKMSTTVANPGSTNILGASASVGATSASYSINVDQLAKNHTVASARQLDSTSALSLAGTFDVNGETVTVVLTDSLTDIRDSINGTADIGVTASIVDNTLRIKSDTSGSDNAITFTDPSNILSDMEVLDGPGGPVKNELVAADDALVYIDGQLVTRSSNTISDAISSVTLNLTGVNTYGVDPAANLSVGRDTTAIVASVQAYVDQYNSVMDFINSKNTEERVPDAKTESDKLKGLLMNDFLLGSIQSGLRLDSGSSVMGLISAANNLAMIGIDASSDSTEAAMGKLEIDAATLTDALNGDIAGVTAEDVQSLFAVNATTEPYDANTTGIAGRIQERIASLVGSGGRVDSMEDMLRGEKDRFQDSIDRLELRVERKETLLIRQFTHLEVVMSSMRTQSDWLTQQIASLPKMT